jgi:DNA-binding CsgD family transcriptional regulator
MILDCHSIDFSAQSSQKRISITNEILGMDVSKRILSFSLYLFGASRISISTSLKIPPDTIKSLIKRIHQKGVLAFNDGRCTNVPFRAPKQRKETTPRISIDDDSVRITVGLQEEAIVIPTKNTIQLKVVLLTLLNAGLITTQEVSQVLNYSINHVQFLNKELHDKDVYALIDKRHGQQQH